MRDLGWVPKCWGTAPRGAFLAAIASIAPWMLGEPALAATSTVSGAGSQPVRAAEREEPRLCLKAYMVWVSSKESKELPKELEPFKERLKKAFRGSTFRLHGQPFSGELAAGKTLSLELPQRYATRWRIADDASREPAVRQTLINPRKLETIVLLKKSPAIVHLERIREGEESFLLIVTFGKTAKPQGDGA